MDRCLPSTAQVNALAFKGGSRSFCVRILVIKHFPTQQPAWGRSREFDITTRTISRHGLTQTTSGDLEDEDEEDDNLLVGGRRRRKGAYMATVKVFGGSR